MGCGNVILIKQSVNSTGHSFDAFVNGTGWCLPGGKAVQAKTWIPARDSPRYPGLRADISF
jgi:hypothetical protein